MTNGTMNGETQRIFARLGPAATVLLLVGLIATIGTDRWLDARTARTVAGARRHCGRVADTPRPLSRLWIRPSSPAMRPSVRPLASTQHA